MPHFSFWAWKLPLCSGPYPARQPPSTPSSSSTPRWPPRIPGPCRRGTAWFNSVTNPRLRQSLLAATRDKPWADVAALDWRHGSPTNAIPIEDFCRFRYVLHTEGVAYSGRFQFLQMCASVVLTPSIQWVQHTTHLIRPVFAADIPELSNKQNPAAIAARERARRAWPVSYRPDEANIVFVAPDWSDLEDVIAWLEDHPKVAQGIASRQRETFVGRGYFSPAAEVCYWRGAGERLEQALPALMRKTGRRRTR